MESILQLPKKCSRFSQEEISVLSIPLQNQDCSKIPAAKKFNKLDQVRCASRKSMDLEKIVKCQQNLELIKRDTDWNRAKVDLVDFQKMIEKRKGRNRFKFKTIDIQSIKPRSHNSSIIEPYQLERLKSIALDFQVKHGRKFSLQKESFEFFALQTELKQLHDKEIEERTKNKVLAQLVQLINFERSKREGKDDQKQQDTSLSEQISKKIRKQEHKMEFFIKLTNDMKDKITNYKKEIFSHRSERVVYSSIFKELEKQIKFTQHLYKRVLINSMTCMEALEFAALSENQNNSSEFQRSDLFNNSYADCSNIFPMLGERNQVNYFKNTNFSEDGTLQQKINSNTALNYYTQSRKVIVFSRYKEHYQSSRKKIIFEEKKISYEQLQNQMNRFFQILGKIEDDPLETLKQSNQKKFEKSLNSTFCKDSYQNSMYMENFPTKQTTSNELAGQNLTQNSQNCYFNTENSVEKVKKLITQIPMKNQALFHEITALDEMIDKRTKQIAKQQQKVKLFKDSQSTKALPSNQFQMDDISQHQRAESLMMQQLQQIKDLLQIESQTCSESSFLSKLQKLDEFYIATKTTCMFQKNSTEQNLCFTFKANQLDTNRSNISIKFKKIDPNIPSNDRVTPGQKDLHIRGPQTLNSILKNIKVCQSYERAFQRMDFQKQYEVEKNRKRKTLIRREGMVSLEVLKRQTNEKNKLLKRQSSNKRNLQNHR